jgi:hypothetical protein
LDYTLKEKLLSTEMGFCRRAAGTCGLLKARNGVIREEIGVPQTFLERMENNILKCYGHVECMQDNRWPERITTWSPEEDDDDKGDQK